MNELQTTLQELAAELRRMNGNIERRGEVATGMSLDVPELEGVRNTILRRPGTRQ